MLTHESKMCLPVSAAGSLRFSKELRAALAPNLLGSLSGQCAEVFTYRGNFYEELRILAATIDNKDPKAHIDDYKNLRFKSFVEQYAPGSLPILNGDPKGGFFHGMSDVEEGLKMRTQVIAAEDDIINAPGAWDPYRHNSGVQVYKTGGHLGFTATKEFSTSV